MLPVFAGSEFLIRQGFGEQAASLRFEEQRLFFPPGVMNAYFASVTADFLRQLLLGRQASFTFETVMSHPGKVALLKQARPEFREILEQSVEAAEKHRDIIAQFGRFPHRNAALGREPTDAETQWLAAGGERFGQ